MNKKYNKLWGEALPYLKKGKRKNFVLHTKEVIKAMELIIKYEGGDESILIPAAILHDVGWSKVPIKLQKSKEKNDKIKALKLHIEYAPPIIQKILKRLKYSGKQVNKISNIVEAHKFKKPKQINKQLLIDADTLAESFYKPFYDDVRAYKSSPRKNYQYKIKNIFYTKTATKIFNKEMEQRQKEIKTL
jgi:HD superfamily phosphodiesterase